MFPELPVHRPPLPPLPISRESMRELQQFVILMLLAEKERLTGYELEKKYKLPRITVLRILEILIANGYVETREEIVSGRAHKYYSITKEGKEYYTSLKEKWAFNLAVMSERAPPERFGFPMFHVLMKPHSDSLLEEFETKEDLLDYLHGIRFEARKHEKRLKERMEQLTFMRKELGQLIQKIEDMENYDIEKAKNFISEFRKAVRKRGENNGRKLP